MDLKEPLLISGFFYCTLHIWKSEQIKPNALTKLGLIRHTAHTSFGSLKMIEPWNRPPGSLIPNRTGDRLKGALFTALGRALSSWEGVHVAIQVLFESFVKHSKNSSLLSNEFEETLIVAKRIRMLQRYANEFINLYAAINYEASEHLRVKLHEILEAYKGWSERRNELAHGYVTVAYSSDYTKDDQPIIPNYSLCPSHVRSARWRSGEPIYNYLAIDVRTFAIYFETLDKRTEELAAVVRAINLEN